MKILESLPYVVFYSGLSAIMLAVLIICFIYDSETNRKGYFRAFFKNILKGKIVGKKPEGPADLIFRLLYFGSIVAILGFTGVMINFATSGNLYWF